jgi:hypothetical protein
MDDITASKSPIVNLDDNNCESELPFAIVIKKPSTASVIPTVCILLSLSPKKSLARNKTVMVSSGPASKPSFEAPILLTESYQVKIPITKNIEAGTKRLHDLKTVILLLFFLAENNREKDNSAAPATGILIAVMAKVGMLRDEWNNSAIIDSKERIAACINTTDDLSNKLL